MNPVCYFWAGPQLIVTNKLTLWSALYRETDCVRFFLLSEPPVLVVPSGSYFVIDTNSKQPEQIVEEMTSGLKVSGLEEKDLFVP